MSYEFNEEAQRIGESVIERWHPHLAGVAIAYITKLSSESASKAPRGGKALKLGSAAAVSEKYQLIANRDYEFIIELTGQYWDRLELNQQEALIDHELCHCRKDGDGFYLADHDVEEFRQILRRHGFWKPDIQAFCEEAQPLFAKPGIQQRFVDPPTDEVVICAGQVIRVEETGDMWTFSVKDGVFVKLQAATETKVTLSGPGLKPTEMTSGEAGKRIAKEVGRIARGEASV